MATDDGHVFQPAVHTLRFNLLLASVYSLTFWIVFDNVEKRVLLIILMLLHLFYCGGFSSETVALV